MSSKFERNGNVVETKADILRQLTEDQVYHLYELYKNKFGLKNFHTLLFYNQLKWDRKVTDILENQTEDIKNWIAFRKSFYTHRHTDYTKYGTYVFLHQDLMQSVGFYSWEPSSKDLYECLSKTKLIDWTNGPLLTNVELHHTAMIKEIALENGVNVQRARSCYGLVMEPEKLLKLEAPKLPLGYRIESLKEENVDLVHSLWANNKESSKQYIQGLININETLGIYSETDNELIGWIFQNDFAGLGILQVSPLKQRMGLGSILAESLSKQIASKENIILSAWVLVENFKSISLFKKIGYETIISVEWIQFTKANV